MGPVCQRGTAAQPRRSPPVSASYLPANCLERAVGRRGPSWVTGPGRAASPLGLEGRCREPTGMSQHSSYDSVFPPGERTLPTTLRRVQGRRARNRTSLYVLVARAAPVGKSPSANPAEEKKSLIFRHHEAVVTPRPVVKCRGAAAHPSPVTSCASLPTASGRGCYKIPSSQKIIPACSEDGARCPVQLPEPHHPLLA